MTFEEAVKYFGTASKMARVLKVTSQATQYWKKTAHIPFVHQLNIERLTEGALIADDENRYSVYYKKNKGDKDD